MLKFNHYIIDKNICPMFFPIFFYNNFAILLRESFLPFQMPFTHIMSPIIRT